MTFFEALILGLIQGLTEFLPISSSGHLELGAYFLNVKTENNLLFAIIVHGATALSTVVVFNRTLSSLIMDLFKFRWNESSIYVSKLLIAAIPVGVIGVLFEEQIEGFFTGNIVFVAFMLIITGLLLLSTHFVKKTDKEVTYTKAFWIGLAQAIAILPGISRSGATISTSLLLNVDKKKATRFSFLIVLVPILGAMFLKSIDLIQDPTLAEGIGISALATGFIAAFISGLLACRWMIAIVRSGKLYYFSVYCFIIAGLVLIAYW